MRFIAALLFGAIVVCGIDFEFVGRLGERGLTPQPYDAFLDDVHRSTPPGASIAIEVPRDLEREYAYRYYRAMYRLPGRRVVPLKDVQDRAHPERLAQADYVASWDGKRGTLRRRAR